MIVTLTNTFHNSSVNVRPGKNGLISARTMRAAKAETCGQKGACFCGLQPATGHMDSREDGGADWAPGFRPL